MIYSKESDPRTGAKQGRWSWRKRLLIYFAITCIAVISWYKLQVAADFEMQERLCDITNPHALKVLFVGNSLTYVKSLPRQFAYLCKQSGYPLKLYQVVEPGQSLAGHFAGGRVLRILSAGGPWDYVVLQEQSTMPYIDRAAMEKYGECLADQVRKRGATPVLLMTWANKGDVRTQKVISKAYWSLGHKLNALVIPDGDVWFTAQSMYPGLDLYAADHHHPGGKGSYLGALLAFCLLTGSKPDIAPAVIPSGSKQYGPLCVLTEAERIACIKLVRDCLNGKNSLSSDYLEK